MKPIGRIGVRPDQPDAVVGPRKRGSRRPHTDATVAGVRALVEESVLTYSEIAAKTGVARASICRWTRDGQWKRPLFAPRATDTVPSHRASARLKARTLHARLAALAERHIRELEASESVDPDQLREALELLKMAKLAARSKRRRSAAEVAAGASLQTWEGTPAHGDGEFALSRREARTRAGRGAPGFHRQPRAAARETQAKAGPPVQRQRDYYAWLREPDERCCFGLFGAANSVHLPRLRGRSDREANREGDFAVGRKPLPLPSPPPQAGGARCRCRTAFPLSTTTPHRQPSPGATCFRIASMTCAL